MSRLRLALEIFFQRQMNQDEDFGLALERMGREIKGSIFVLLTLFFLVALTSYLPIDVIHLNEGSFDQIKNLGGIVGAATSHWFLGSVGISGYTVVALLAWLAICSFRGTPLSNNLFRIFGICIATALSAITIHLICRDHFPEMSLLQGGWLGKQAGSVLLRYFNSAGALILVSGGFLFTFIITSGLSLSQTVKPLMGLRKSGSQSAEEEDDFLNEEEDEFLKSLTPLPVLPRNEPTIENSDEDEDWDEEEPAPKPKAKKKKRAKKKTPAKVASTDDDLDTTDDSGDSSTEPPSAGDEEFPDVIPFTGTHSLPTTRLLKAHSNGAKKISKKETKEASDALKEHLLSFQITGEVTGISHGPVLTTYEYKPSKGIKLSKIAALEDDLAVVLGASELRIMAPIPGKTVVGIEVPRPLPEVISFKDIVGTDEFYSKKLKLPIALGKNTDGDPEFGDLAAMPHLLVAGATGSGKSVFINTMIASFLYRLSPQELRMILIDPKMLELNCFEGLPHLLTNVITKSDKATRAMNWAVEEMERRYELMAKTGSKNIESYNSKQKSAVKKLPFIVIVVDELADLMMSGDKDAVETAITRLAQKARAAGIHLVIATQRPSTEVITGLIKANIPSRLSFKVPSAVDSRTVLDTSGAQSLIGKGDSLMVRPAKPLQRIHGCFISEEELERVVKNVIGGKRHDSIYIDFS